MKFLLLSTLAIELLILQKNFNLLPIFPQNFSHTQTNCRAVHQRHHLTNHRQSVTDENPYAPIFDPYSSELAQQLMAVFGQDSLAARTQLSEKKSQEPRKFGVSKTATKAQKAKAKAASIKSVLSDLSKQLPFQSDMNLGSNSNTDVYVEFNATKDWQINKNLDFNTQQTFRYGAQSRNYSQTNFNFTQKQEHQAITSNQLSVIKTEEDTYKWKNYLFRKHKLDRNQSLTYGIYTKGIYSKEKHYIELQNWGPYLTWRRPIWRTWLYLENQLSYYQDRTNNDKRNFSATVRFEMTF